MKICIIGTGYVGLTEGICFANFGHNVICVDIDELKIKKLQQGIPTIYEYKLEEMLNKNIQSKKISFTTNIAEALGDSTVVMVCVNTPENPKTGKADLTYLIGVIKSIALKAKAEKKYTLIIKSTVPVGTNKMLKNILIKENPNFIFNIVSNPEFSRQGIAIEDFSKPDRIIIGIENEESKNVIEELYQPITNKGYPIFFSSIETAELIKYASNAFLATKIAFINEIADICEKTGADIKQISKAMGMDKRISPYFLNAGPGIGGSCFPKDSIALSKIGKSLGLNLEVISSVVSSNTNRKNNLAKKIVEKSEYSLKDKKIALLGLTYKENTDDTRYSPALSIIENLTSSNIKINAYDPKGIEKARSMLSENALKNVTFFKNIEEVFEDVEMIVIVTEWTEFKTLDYKKILESIKQKIIVDFRSILDKEYINSIGYKYYCTGCK